MVGATYSKYVVVTIAYITTVFSLIMYFCSIMCDILKQYLLLMLALYSEDCLVAVH